MTIRIKKDGTQQSGLVDDNLVQPFRLEKSSVRGRVVRLGSALGDIIGKHDYPPPVLSLLSEAVTLCLLLSAMLKYEGIFSLQIKSDGPVRLLVADVTTRAEVRAYASFDEAAVKKAAKRKQDVDHHYYHLLGKKGYIAFTVDQGISENRYQGIVELKGESIVDAVLHYFTQSEQIKTSFKIAVHPQDGHWRAGGIMIQHMPEEGGKESTHEASLDDWTRAALLLETCTDGELLSPILSSTDLLYRLFHEDGVRVYSPSHVRFKCRCNSDKVLTVLRTIPRAEVEDICRKDGSVFLACEFCGHKYTYGMDDLDTIYGEKTDESK